MPKMIQFPLRLHPEIDSAVRKMAEINDRNINQQINHMLRQQIPVAMMDAATADIAPDLARVKK
jgi:hypothetical protein